MRKTYILIPSVFTWLHCVATFCHSLTRTAENTRKQNSFNELIEQSNLFNMKSFPV